MERGEEGRRRLAHKEDMTVRWLLEQQLFHMLLPDSEKTVLPWRYRVEVYEAFKVEMTQARGYSESELPTRQYFCHIWKTNPDTINVILRRWLPFARCDICTSLRDKRDETKNRKARAEITRQLREHVKFVRRERMSYYYKKRLATQRPEEYISVIIDGADQSDYNIPYRWVKTKTQESAWRVPVKLMGAIVHGRGHYAFTHIKNVKAGTNVTIETLHRVLIDILDKEETLPSKLYLQLDNTVRQCKSRFLQAVQLEEEFFDNAYAEESC